MIKNKIILLVLLLLTSAIALGGLVPGVISANRSTSIGTLSPLATATARISALQVEPRSANRSTPTPTDIKNCTYSVHYWVNQPESWPPEISLGGKVYTREEAYLLLISETEDIWNIVLKEAYVALLNIYQGASKERIEAILIDTDDWLRKNPSGRDLSLFTQQQGQAFINQLNDFNNGLLWPRACPDSGSTSG